MGRGLFILHFKIVINFKFSTTGNGHLIDLRPALPHFRAGDGRPCDPRVLRFKLRALIDRRVDTSQRYRSGVGGASSGHAPDSESLSSGADRERCRCSLGNKNLCCGWLVMESEYLTGGFLTRDGRKVPCSGDTDVCGMRLGV